jgi:chromosomal replication initiation ATPase DnaA
LQSKFNQMKREIFNQYVDKLCELFGITRDDLISTSKRGDLSDARHMLYYLCSKRQISVSNILKYLLEMGLKTSHSTISYGIQSVEDKCKIDNDYVQVITKIEKTTQL